MTDTFHAVLYLKAACPHCLKLRIFLLEAGLMERFDMRVFTPGDDNETDMRAELAPWFEKVTFPTVQHTPGAFMNESDAIIALYAQEAGLDPARLPTFVDYTQGVLPKYQRMRRELVSLGQPV
ncbi:glutathione S-transferase N-terminal domain-containing protein [Novosphingobium sp. 9]|uniref:glutathione S-transferase N-terminal domain-containing protein n=1 Tax=Novosphingobium sp. 9 TaxID=2025349 RepID=UPI0021B578AB|nr:glutathione S-transferase N-terminal domain-containing protein [Novosphingobium sp. 9]